MKKILALLLTLAVALFACSFAFAEGETHKMGIDLCTDDLFNQTLRDTLVAACEERGWDYVVTVNYQDAANNMANVQNLLTVECDLILSYSTDIGGMENVRQLCDDAGVTVVFVGLEEEGYTIVGGGNYDGGVACGKNIVAKANEKWGGDIDLVIVNEFAEVGMINTLRMGGMVDGVKEAAPQLTDDQFIHVDGGLDVMKSTEVVAAVLTAHPEAEHILCLCAVDDYQGMGSWNAANAAGRQDQIMITGFHCVNPATPGLLINEPDIWIGQADLPASEYAKTALEMFDALLAGEDIVGQMWYCDYLWLDGSNVADYYEVVS